MLRRHVLGFLENNYQHKFIIAATVEVILFMAILVLSYWIRLGAIGEKYVPQLLFLLATYIPLKLFVFWMFSLYIISFRYFSLYESQQVLKASLISAAFLALIGLVFRDSSYMSGYPRSIVFIDFLLTFIISCGIRAVFRIIYSPNGRERGAKRMLIMGAGNAGVQLLRELKASSSAYLPMAFIDDDPNKQGTIINGIKVMGKREDIPRIVSDLNIEIIIIAIPSASTSQLREIMNHVRKSRVSNIKIIPGLFHILTGKVKIGDLKEISIEDFLARETVKFELDGISSYLKGKRVLVTGAGGSIGSELCRQIANLEPKCLIMVDVGDTELFYVTQEIKGKFPEVSSVSILADIKDARRMRYIFENYFPQVVLHAAAYKHVPLMEGNPGEAVLNNIEGTKIPALLSREYGAEKFIFISTDKAVNPTSVMGATKRVTENMLKSLNGGITDFVSVRFGNVLDSRGSVIPIFKEQVRSGGPVTVTHPDMVRYFMSITEAVFLVLQAGAIGRGGEVFVLDMGKPVKILDLARDVIRFYGLEPDKDIPIVFTGLRPGEKLFEEMLTAEEGTALTMHKKIFIANDENHIGIEYIEKVKSLITMAKRDSTRERIIPLLRELLPTYQSEAIQDMDSEIEKWDLSDRPAMLEGVAKTYT
jgi:FlaA1/EpsC-like NDP-sugar epimerase